MAFKNRAWQECVLKAMKHVIERINHARKYLLFIPLILYFGTYAPFLFSFSVF